MKKFVMKSSVLLVAAGIAAGAMAAESLQDVMKRRNLSQQDLLAASKTYVPTGKRDEFLAFRSGGQSGQGQGSPGTGIEAHVASGKDKPDAI